MILTTQRLILRELEEADWPALYAFESDPDAVRYQSYSPQTPEECREKIRRAMADLSERPRRTYNMAVVLHEERQLIGRCGLQIENGELREGQLWYILHRGYWGHGYMPEAARALLNFGFVSLGLHRVWADCDPANHASVRVLEKLGMRREGHFRENARLKGEWVDSLIFAILDREWTP